MNGIVAKMAMRDQEINTCWGLRGNIEIIKKEICVLRTKRGREKEYLGIVGTERRIVFRDKLKQREVSVCVCVCDQSGIGKNEPIVLP